MADSIQPLNPKKIDTLTAKNTLNFLGRCLREQRFILRGQLIRKQKLVAEIVQTQKMIENIHQRIHCEFQMNPNIFKKINTPES
jgi:hypothetical protein